MTAGNKAEQDNKLYMQTHLQFWSIKAEDEDAPQTSTEA